MSKTYEVGDTVLVPCRVVGKCLMAYSNDVYALDLQPIESTSGEPYTVRPPFTIVDLDVAHAKE
jgi:hypothetical protein